MAKFCIVCAMMLSSNVPQLTDGPASRPQQVGYLFCPEAYRYQPNGSCNPLK